MILTSYPCGIDGCSYVQPFSVGLETKAEMERLKPRILTAAGWLHLAGAWTCPSCSAISCRIEDMMTFQQAAALSSALIERDMHGKIEVRGE